MIFMFCKCFRDDHLRKARGGGYDGSRGCDGSRDCDNGKGCDYKRVCYDSKSCDSSRYNLIKIY